MKLVRVLSRGRTSWGLLEGDRVVLLETPPWEGLRRTAERLPLAEVKLLAPCAPQKILGVGLNYRAHAAEMKKPLPSSPLLFLKPPTALLDPGEPIVLPSESAEVHHEAELAVVLSRPARRVSPDEARRCVLGVICFNDVTARDIQRAEVQYTRAKGFDSFAPAGPWVDTAADPRSLPIVCRVNGEVRQRGDTSDMVFDVFALVSFASQGMTLLAGDVLTTGTPPGVGPLSDGDTVEVEIGGVGVLSNPVRAEARR
jgi:2-keto-4-pentenoate hydratase/2-oxohepta-3-ene-1,7-dioic acid hydratase in catechol pathway